MGYVKDKSCMKKRIHNKNMLQNNIACISFEELLQIISYVLTNLRTGCFKKETTETEVCNTVSSIIRFKVKYHIYSNIRTLRVQIFPCINLC